jgi:hypothetical protein
VGQGAVRLQAQAVSGIGRRGSERGGSCPTQLLIRRPGWPIRKTPIVRCLRLAPPGGLPVPRRSAGARRRRPVTGCPQTGWTNCGLCAASRWMKLPGVGCVRGRARAYVLCSIRAMPRRISFSSARGTVTPYALQRLAASQERSNRGINIAGTVSTPIGRSRERSARRSICGRLAQSRDRARVWRPPAH